MIEVDLCSMKPEAISTTPVPPLFSVIKTQPNITETLNLNIQGAVEWLHWAFSTASMPASQHGTPRRRPPSVALGDLPPIRVEDPLSLEGADSAMPKLMATSPSALQHMAMPDDILTTVPISHSPSLLPALRTPTAASSPTTPWSESHPSTDPGVLSEEVLQLQREMNAAMGWPLTTRATMDSCWRRLVFNTKTTLHQNEVNATEDIKEVKIHCTAMIWDVEAIHVAAILDAEAACAVTIREAETDCTHHAHTLQQSLGESMQDLECKAIEEEGLDCQSFLEACRAALQGCPTKACGVLLYHLQLLTGNMPLAILLVTSHYNWETYPNNSLSDHVRDTHTFNGDQTMMPLVWLGGSISQIRGGRGCSVRYDPRGAAPPKVKRWEASGKNPEIEPSGGLF